MDARHAAHVAEGPPARPPRRDPRGAVAVLSAVLLAGAGGLLLVALRGPAGATDARLPWWLFALPFAVVELWVVRVEVRREAHIFTLVEVPLVLALFLASPGGLIAARLAGAALALAFRLRSVRKIVFNLSLYTAETALAAAIFGALTRSPNVTSPASWAAALVAVVAQNLLGAACVSLVIRWHGGHPDLRSTAALGALAVLANTSLALTAAVLVHVTLAGVALLVALGIVLLAAYSGYTSLSRRYASLQLLYDFTRAVGGAHRAEGILTAILDEARRALRSDVAEAVLVNADDADRCFHVRAVEGEPVVSEVVPRGAAALWSRTVDRDDVLFVARHPKSRDERAVLEQLGVRDLVAAPLRHQGAAVGYLLVAERMGELGTFDAQDARLLETLANHASVSIENGRLLDRLAHEIEERARLAATDALTGLANRAAFVERVKAALEHRDDRELVAVMLMDLDRFKDVNDTLGHNVGDEVLCQVAARLLGAVAREASVARLGGDEFAVLLPGLSEESQALDAARVLRGVLLPPFHVRDVALEIGASVGIALAPTHGTDAHAALKSADIAMYAAKQEPTGVQVYDEASDEHSVPRLALVGALREAIEADELLVYFQPKVRMADEAVVGAEALVRWQHPEHGMLSPDVFITIAERTGLIGGLTRLVARRAAGQCAQWRAQGFDLSMAVNISVLSLLDVEFPDTISALLLEAGLAPEHLTLEITESTIMDPVRTVAALERLAALGVRLSVDDFGTGYSSLTYLQRLPVHEVKVDRSFVMTMGTSESDAAIVKSIVELGHNLGLRVVAEGVEDRVTWDRLAHQGCDVAQGYYLSKPIPADAFTQWLNEWEPQRVKPVAAVERVVSAIASWR